MYTATTNSGLGSAALEKHYMGLHNIVFSFDWNRHKNWSKTSLALWEHALLNYVSHYFQVDIIIKQEQIHSDTANAVKIPRS